MDKPNAMQNIRMGMLATRVPVDVVPNAPRWPSWKIQTSAPNAAVNDKTLSSNAFSGSTTLPVSMNSSMNVITAITVSTAGIRDVTAVLLSRLTCAVPVSNTSWPAGPTTACRRSSCVSDASLNNGVLLATVTNARLSLTPVAAVGGPTGTPCTNIPLGVDTDDTSGTLDSAAP